MLRRVRTVQRELYSSYQHSYQPGTGIVIHPAAAMRWYELLGKVADALVAQNECNEDGV